MKIKMLILASLSLLFTGCIDIFHTVSLHKGRADISVRYTIQKGMLDMAASFSGEPMDYSEFTDIGDEIFGEFNGISAEILPIETSYHIGAQVKFKGQVDSLAEELEETIFLPVKSGKSYEIAIPGMKDAEDTDETALSFIAGSKYMLLVDLSGDLRDIKNASLEISDPGLANADAAEMAVEIYGSSMVIEIPMILLFLSDEEIIIKLY